jgi:predicted amidohydrolase YtcJ
MSTGSPRFAELALVNGKVRTPVSPSGFTRAAAISGGTVLALCGDDEVRDFIGPGTRVVDLRGRLAIPAFGDAHVHPVQGGLESLRCDLTGLKTKAGYLDAVAATYQAAAAGRLLTCRVTGALWWDRSRGLHQLDTPSPGASPT